MNHRTLSRPLTRLLLLACLVLPNAATYAQDGFIVRDIEVEGLQRITEGTLFSYLPLNIGDELTQERSAQAIRALFETGFFHDISFRRDGDTLVIEIIERPTIARFSFSGNRDIKDDDLRRVLRDVGLAEGRIFNRAMLDGVETELRRQYFSRGKYGVKVDTEVTELEDNLVTVSIEISEGRSARIRKINFIGNDSFSDRELLAEMELSTPNLLSFYRRDDQYARERLEGDLEALRSFYMDQGFANYSSDATQVAISPDMQDIYITIHIQEGARYTFGEIQLAGDLIVDEEELLSLVQFETGDGFSRRAIVNTDDLISLRLGEEGYAFAEVNALPEMDHESRVVNMLLFVEPGNRVYVRRIGFTGAPRTNDITFRREMRQLESSWISTRDIERSRLRLQRLPFVQSVEVDTVQVPGSGDLVDIDVNISERAPGDFNFGIGYSSAFDLFLNVGITHSNFLGSGKRVALDLNRSQFSELYSFQYMEPYHTVEGISRSLSFSYRRADQLFARTSPFFINAASAAVSYGFPVTEIQRISAGLAVRETELIASDFSSNELRAWLLDPAHGNRFVDPFFGLVGSKFLTLELTGGWTYDDRDRALFPSRGSRRQFNFELAVPPSEVRYVITHLLNQTYFPLTDDFTVSVKGEVSLGKALGDASLMPPYKNFFGGGPDHVRGWRESWLGPRDSNNRPFGGNIRVFGQAELILRPPMDALRNSTRFSLFYDVGNVFQGRDSVELDEMRMSIGLGATWLGPLGAMRFSYAFPLYDEPGDILERFQFSIGSAF